MLVETDTDETRGPRSLAGGVLASRGNDASGGGLQAIEMGFFQEACGCFLITVYGRMGL